MFPDLASDQQRELEARREVNARLFKIKYTLNLLPQIDNYQHHDRFMELLGDTDQIELFQTKVVKDLIQFKWDEYGKNVHYLAATVHGIYVITFLVHLDQQYLRQHLRTGDQVGMQFPIMTCCNLFAMVYDIR